MSTCAIQISGKYNEEGEFISICTPNIPKRGICSNCWKHLVEQGLIIPEEPYPEWLTELIKMQDVQDQRHIRHPEILSVTLADEFEVV